MSPDHGRHGEPAVDVREELGATLEILVDGIATQRSPVDLEENEVGSPMEVGVGHSRKLVSIRAVNEPIGIEPLGDVHASYSSINPSSANASGSFTPPTNSLYPTPV